jgi:hypothetical protein
VWRFPRNEVRSLKGMKDQVGRSMLWSDKNGHGWLSTRAGIQRWLRRGRNALRVTVKILENIHSSFSYGLLIVSQSNLSHAKVRGRVGNWGISQFGIRANDRSYPQ